MQVRYIQRYKFPEIFTVCKAILINRKCIFVKKKYLFVNYIILPVHFNKIDESNKEPEPTLEAVNTQKTKSIVHETHTFVEISAN
jgi:hypothetical protein